MSRRNWGLIPAHIWWTIWKERNCGCFENKSSTIWKIKLSGVLLFFWCIKSYPEDT
ncbi:hypothetical protein MTR67_015406 [Solanum verrucosum]|uniref:Uncharacterized protein n=1 Tax=Solanum verrucosum TaxID=315347 RepID=A0AAF0QEZ1_SOLVR|nr:hypothetical protein MTR67_015406 [Solanum verrucosum]